MGELAEVVDLASRRRSAVVDEPRETKRELARRWGVSERSIERWMRERGLPYEKPFDGGMVRFVPSVVDEWFARASA